MASFCAHQSQKADRRSRTYRSHGGGPGNAGAEVQRGAQFLLRDPGQGDLLPGLVGAAGLDDLGELGGRQVLQVADQEVLHPVPGVAGFAAPSVLLPDRAAPAYPVRPGAQSGCLWTGPGPTRPLDPL
jgi:hypothetical protein